MDQLETQVSESMNNSVRTVPGWLSPREAAAVFDTEDIGSVVVETAAGNGILTKTDIVAGLSTGIDPDKTSVSELMSAPPISIDRDATLRQAVDTMSEHGIKRLLVEEAGTPVGMLTTTDVVDELSPDLDRIVDMFADD
jgi:signal-transduction protein with cAMP-binding, CBS, and nucleotidyltransferase domain